MKKMLTLTLLTSLLALAACGGSASEESASQFGENDVELSMPHEMELIIGTVKLDKSEYPIDATQAEALLPLWKALRSLSESETAATAEIDAIINQIDETMTAEQMDAIADMELGMDDFGDVRETLGIEGGFGNFGDITPEMRTTMEAARESGEGPPAGFGGGPGMGGGQGFGGGQGPGGGGGFDPAARETAIAERGGNRGVNIALNKTILDAIIKFLENKIE